MTLDTERTDDEFIPCPRHGTHCFPEFRNDLAQRIEVAIGLGERGPDGVRATRDRIMMMIEDHDAERGERVVPLVQELVDLFAEHIGEGVDGG